jgi:hypothetical protein
MVVLQTLKNSFSLKDGKKEKTSQERHNNRDRRKNNDNVFASVQRRSFLMFEDRKGGEKI